MGPLDHALELAQRGLYEVEPNPRVGAVLVRDGEWVGQGWHRAWGRAHAEREALAAAGERARGASLYVTLEPCSTRGKTGACTDAILAAGVTRVVLGALDPNPAHAGRGLGLMAAAGLAVEHVQHPGCQALADDFATLPGSTASMSRSAPARPYVFAKWAQSAEGALAGPGGQPVHLTGLRADARVHHWRAHLDGLLVGVGTVVADDPLLTARGHEGPFRPLRRIVLDPTLRLPLHSRLVDTAGECPTWVLTREDADQQPEAALESEGVSVLRVPGREQEWLAACLASLRLSGVQRLMVEGGAATLSSFLAAGLVDHVAVLQTPRELGPLAGPRLEGWELGQLDADGLARALQLEQVRCETLGDDLLVRGRRPAGT